MKQLIPSQSHAMVDVGYHWANLWFAAEKKNWPLAEFYFDETHQHIAWMIAIRPVRFDAEGNALDLKATFDPIDTGAFAAVKQAITSRQSAAFATAYRASLEACYSCHKAAGKPYLRPMMPTMPSQSIVHFDPEPAGR